MLINSDSIPLHLLLRHIVNIAANAIIGEHSDKLLTALPLTNLSSVQPLPMLRTPDVWPLVERGTLFVISPVFNPWCLAAGGQVNTKNSTLVMPV